MVTVAVTAAMVAAAGWAVGDSLAGSLPLAPLPAWHTQQRSRTEETVSQMG